MMETSQGQDKSFNSTVVHNYSTVSTTKSIYENGDYWSTTEAPAVSIGFNRTGFTDDSNSSTTVSKLFTSSPTIYFADETVSGWMQATDVLDSFVFVCACVALLFNLSNIVVIIMSKLYLKITYKLFISQAVSNAVTALSMGMTYIASHYFNGNSQLIIAISSYNILQIGSMACVLTYTFISLELYFQIILPFKHRYMGFTFKVALFLIWIIPMLLTESIQIGITLSKMESNETFLVTYVRLQDNTLGYLNTGLALICLIVIIYLNIALLKAVYRSLKSNPREGKGIKKSTITIITMVSTYIIFYLPSWVVGIIFVLHNKYKVLILASLTMHQRLFLVTCLSNLKILNTIADPVIYVLRINVIQDTYKKLVIKYVCCGQVTNTNTDSLKLTSTRGNIYRDNSTASNKSMRVSVVTKSSEM